MAPSSPGGGNSHDESTVPEGLSDVTAITAGVYYTVALKNDGTLVMWGANDSGQITLPGAVANVFIDHGAIVCQSPITEGGNSVCAITPDPGYHLATFTVNDVDKLTGVVDNSYTINDIRAYQIVAGTFAEEFTPPGAPSVGAATPGNAQATVSFSAPADNGGSAITGYTVISNPGGLTATGAVSPLTVTGLTNGTAYTFTVIATNVTGNGPASAASNSVTPCTIPGVPTIGRATKGYGRANIAFTPPASDGGSAITLYTVTSIPGGKRATGKTSPITVTGLTNGKAYKFTVVATNSVGSSAASAASNSVTPALSVPDSPIIGTATKGNASAKVAFKPPVSNGGSPIKFYTVTASPGGKKATGKKSPITITGLTNGRTYTFTVKATNAIGTSTASKASNRVTPARK